MLDKAVQADGLVRERYQSHRDTIALLCKPEPELNAAIPSANPAKTMQGSEVRSCCPWGGCPEMGPILTCSGSLKGDKPQRTMVAGGTFGLGGILRAKVKGA